MRRAGSILLLLLTLAVARCGLTLWWQFAGDRQNIVFNVWIKTNLTEGNWQLLTTVTGLSLALPAPELPQQYFAVTASNTATGEESGFATTAQ